MTKRRRIDHTPPETLKFTAQEVADFQAGIRRFASLLVVAGSEADLGMHVLLDRPVHIGRDPGIEMRLEDVGISRRHARIFRDEKRARYLVEDLGSTNGTRLNGVRLSRPHPLAEGDKISVGSTVIRFAYTDEVDVGFHEKLQRIVGLDDLTGLEAKRSFDAAYRIAVRSAVDTGRPLAVLMMDMDGLKPINDTYGHHMGAYAIREVGRLIAQAMGDIGRSCRFGGDEFMAYLPTTGREVACEIAEAIRLRVAEHRFEHEGIVVSPTLSIGVAVLPQDATAADDLTRRADEALYRAKAQGKNRVSV
jgi:diguanylate cyclase (GGDEF)-like protein